MSLTQQELNDIKTLLNRDPSVVETYIFDTMWSEHCSYKSTKKVLKRFPTKGSEVALGIGEDAGIIRFTTHNDKQYCIAVSHESHNHPSQVLPIEGAATGVGGCVRDVYCMGADVIGVLDSLHFGDSASDSGSMVDEIAEKVVEGVADYGNPLGVPVLGGETLYHSSYNENCLVNVAALGLLAEDDIVHSYVPECAKDVIYDVILFGKSTDMTGFGGASFSSATLDQDNQAANIGAVQVHDPFLKRVLAEAIKSMLAYVKKENIQIGFKDLGAGGISCACSEIAVGGGFGVTLNLDLVNQAIEGLPPEVIACSETQERFCLVVPRSQSKAICDIFNVDFDLPSLYPQAGAVVIGEVTKEKKFHISYKGNVVCDIPVAAITTDVYVERKSQSRPIQRLVSSSVDLGVSEIKNICTKMLSSKHNRNKRAVYTHFDNAVRGDTVIYPGEGDAVVTTPVKGSSTGLVVSMDSNLYGHVDPYIAGAAAVAESIRNIISVGGKPIALTDCLNYGNPEKPSVFFDFERGVEGISEAAEQLSFIENEPVPIISGNVSLYNESKQGAAIIPSPVILCIGKIEDYKQALSMQLFKENETLYLIGNRYPEFGGTQLAQFVDVEEVAPQVRFEQEHRQNQCVHSLISSGKLTACHDISAGGLWITLVEMILGERSESRVGATINFPSGYDLSTLLFSENGGYVVSCSEENKAALEELFKLYEVSYFKLGETTSTNALSFELNDTPVFSFTRDDLVKAWNVVSR